MLTLRHSLLLLPTGGPPPTFVASTGSPQAFSTDPTFTIPGATLPGDLIVVWLCLQPAKWIWAVGQGFPSGWHNLTPLNAQNANHVFWKFREAGDPNTVTFPSQDGSIGGSALMLVYRYVHATEGIVGWKLTEYGSTTTPASTSFNPTDWTADDSGTLVLGYATAGARPRALLSGPSGASLRVNRTYVTNGGTCQLFDRSWSDKTNVSAQTATYDSAQENHVLALMLAPLTGTVVHEAGGAVSASASVTGALVQAVPAVATVVASASVSASAAVGSRATLAATATVEADTSVRFAGAASIAATGLVSGSAALATAGEGQPLSATATIAGTLAVAKLAQAALSVSAAVDGDGIFAVAGTADVIATFDFDLNAGLILFAEGDIYAFGELETVLFPQVRRKAAGDLDATGAATLAGFIRMAASGAVTGTATITKAFAGRERRDAPTLAAVANAALAGLSGPGGHAVVFPSVVMTGDLLKALTGHIDITAEGRIADFAPGAVVTRIASASITSVATATGTARRDTSAAGTLTASGATTGRGGLLQRAVAAPGASGEVALDALIAIGGAGLLSVPVVLVGAALRTIYDNRHLHADTDMIGTARRETFSVVGLEVTAVAIGTAGYRHLGAGNLTASADVTGPTAGHLVKGAGSPAATATASLGQVLLGSSAHLTATGALAGSAPLTRIAAASMAVTATASATGGYRKAGAAAITATATAQLDQTSIALGASASVFVFGLVLATVAPFQLGAGDLVAEATVTESGSVRLLGSRVFIHAEAFVWPRGGFPIDGAAAVTCGTEVAATAA